LIAFIYSLVIAGNIKWQDNRSNTEKLSNYSFNKIYHSSDWMQCNYLNWEHESLRLISVIQKVSENHGKCDCVVSQFILVILTGKPMPCFCLWSSFICYAQGEMEASIWNFKKGCENSHLDSYKTLNIFKVEFLSTKIGCK